MADPVFGSGNPPVGLPSACRPPAAAVRPAHPSYPRRRHSLGKCNVVTKTIPPPRSSAGETGWGRAGRAGGAA